MQTETATSSKPEMKKFYLLYFMVFMVNAAAWTQVTETSGKAIAEIFTDFHINIDDTAKNTGFDLNRAYFGYHFMPVGKISAKIIVNIGSPDDLADGSVPKRYAFCREASLIWSDERLTVSVGITGTRIFEFQQRFWGKRYVANTYQSINGYGFVADLGAVIDYKFNDIIKADLSVMNGEGYCNLQQDDNVRTSAGITITPVGSVALRLYGDIQKREGLWQPVFVGFAGIKNDLLTLGGEVSYKSNIDLVKGHHAWGISISGGINLNERFEVFGRYDYISSVVLSNESVRWNYLNDGSFGIAGIQMIISPSSKLALNYQGRFSYASTSMSSDMVFLNVMFRF